MMRLDKYLCETGLGSRNEVKAYLKKGLVTVNGETVKKSETKIDEKKDIVCFQEKPLRYEAFQYFLLHKPAGCVTAVKDDLSRTVMDYLPKERRKDLFPVGRLDKDTEGLLLITNDGALAHELLSPRRQIDKTYYARIDGPVDEEQVRLFRQGVDIGDETKTLPAVLHILNSGTVSEIELTIREGRFHQVKRMFEAVGRKVLYLKRLRMGTLTLGSLPPGEVRILTDDEILRLKQRESAAKEKEDD